MTNKKNNPVKSAVPPIISGALTGATFYAIAAFGKHLDLQTTHDMIVGDIDQLKQDSSIVANSPFSIEAKRLVERRDILNPTSFKAEIKKNENELKQLEQKNIVGELGFIVPIACVLAAFQAAAVHFTIRASRQEKKSAESRFDLNG